VTVGIDQAPTGCNPNTATGDTFADQLILSAVLPSAFTVDNQGMAQYDPALIVSAELHSTNPQTVVYTINPKAVWSDGTPITAADFIYAWQHQRAVPPGQVGGDADVSSTAGYQDISTMTPANHGRTLTVVFSTPYADWQSLFGDLLPAHVLQGVGWSPGCTDLDPAIDLSGGPFEIASVTDTAIVLVRNPKWWGQEQPKLARLVIKIATGPKQLADWLYHGVIDVSAPSYFDPSFLQDVTSLPFAKSQMEISNTFLELEFATAGVLTANPLVRDGIAFAIDRQQLSNRVAGWADPSIAPSTSHLYAQGESTYPSSPAPVPANVTTTTSTTTTTVPTTSNVITAAGFPITSDPAREAKDLSDAGYLRDEAGEWVDTAGHPLSVRLAIDRGDEWAAQTGDLVAAQLRAQGIAVSTLDEPDADSAGAQLLSGTVDLALVPLHSSPYASRTSAWYSPLLELSGGTGEEDWSGYDSVRVNNLFTQAMSELDPVTAQPLYNQIDKELWVDMVALPLFAEPDVLAWSGYVSGIATGPYAPGLFSTVLDWARLVREPTTYTGTPRIRGS
jgi:peptide/nickel transport system substrate-binding protein